MERRLKFSTAKRKSAGTTTSAFGSPGRINHDSSKFYGSRLYEGLPREEQTEYMENPVSTDCLDRVFCRSSESMEELPENSVHLMVTSPPYNVGKEYDQDLTLTEYREFLKRIWKEVYRILVPGGRACVNLANLGRKPYLPLHIFVIKDMIDLGFLMRGEIIWNKGTSVSPSTAWGTWQSAKNPILRDIHEYILVFSKKTFTRKAPKNRKNTISKKEFLEFTKSIWTFPAESATKIGHPAPFPVELPYRLIQLYTFEDEIVLDPFIGSGQTAIAALKSGRHFVGYDINQDYVRLAERRIKQYMDDKSTPKLLDLN